MEGVNNELLALKRSMHKLDQVNQTSVDHIGIHYSHLSFLFFCNWVLLGLQPNGKLAISQERYCLKILEIIA